MKKFFLFIAVFAVIGFAFYKKVYIPKHTFEVVGVSAGDMEVKVNGIGNVGAKNIYKIGSLYGGKVIQFAINEGEFIKKGSLIAVIDSVDLKDQIAQIQANIQKLTYDKLSAIENYKYQNEIYKKNKKLFQKHTISALDFMKYKTNKKSAKLKIDSLQSAIVQAQKNVDALKERLKRFRIVAPVDGYVTHKYIANYQNIQPNQPIIDIVNPKDVWIATYIDTRISGDVKVGFKALIKLQSSQKIYNGYVANIKPLNNPITYEREIDVKFDNLPLPFYLNEQASIDIKIKKLHNVLQIDSKALTMYDGKRGVWIVKNNIVSFKAVKILNFGEKKVAVTGIQQNDKIVIPNLKNKPLSNGMKIIIKG